MKLLLSNIIIGLDDGQKEIKQQVAHKLRLKIDAIKDIRIVKQSVDARKKPGIRFVYSISCEIDDNIRMPNSTDIRVL